MICYDDFSKSNISKHNPNWPQALDHPYITLLVRGSGSGKTNILLNLIKRQDDDDYSIIYKIYLYVKHPNQARYQYFIKNYEKMVLKV